MATLLKVFNSWYNNTDMFTYQHVKARPHLYANANKACGMVTNAKRLLVQHSPHEWTIKHSIGSSLAARMNICPHQYDGERIFLWSTDSRRIVFVCSSNIRRISKWRWMLFTYTFTLCVLCAFSRLFRIRIQMWTRLNLAYWFWTDVATQSTRLKPVSLLSLEQWRHYSSTYPPIKGRRVGQNFFILL